MASGKDNLPTKKASADDVNAFLQKVATAPKNKAAGERGRLIFALDATASRQPTWDRAAQIQAEMFAETANLGGLEIQVVFYRGFGEFRASSWLTEPSDMLRLMTSVYCMAGETQIRKVLSHATNEAKHKRVNALVFVGDCVEEDVDHLGALAGELGLLGVPAFLFHEGFDPIAEFAFKEIARLTNGACCRFDASSANVLKELLSAVAVYAAGGRAALDDLAKKRGGETLRIAHQVKGG
ncbi:MAG: VWA domain-containing protein [Rhodospirillales bacterium]|nr:VWA domain-containing protein [Rhodospirillales bacterium]